MSILFIVATSYCVLSVIAYFILMIYYSNGLSQLSLPTIQQNNPRTFITLIVCFRNEENNLAQLIKSLVEQHYPANLFEIILYNDASKDGSLAIIKNCQTQFTQHQIICKEIPYQHGANSAKKLALNDAAANSKAELIVVTDADCVLHPNWLTLIEQTYRNENALMITATVAIERTKGWLNELQFIELQALASVSAGAIGKKNAIMCNGANMAFDRKTFLSLNPYHNNLHVSSGDDIFLMMSMQKKYPQSIVFLAHPHAVVYTKGKANFRDYFNQRIRWASKSKNYTNNAVKFVALAVLNCNFILFISPIFLCISPMVNGMVLLFSLILIKYFAELILLSKFSKSVGIKVNYLKLFFYQYHESLLTIIVGIKSIKGTYTWKDRQQHF